MGTPPEPQLVGPALRASPLLTPMHSFPLAVQALEMLGCEKEEQEEGKWEERVPSRVDRRGAMPYLTRQVRCLHNRCGARRP